MKKWLIVIGILGSLAWLIYGNVMKIHSESMECQGHCSKKDWRGAVCDK